MSLHLRPYQQRLHDDVSSRIGRSRNIVVQSPTGSGKSINQLADIIEAHRRGMTVAWYSPRVLLTNQFRGYLEDAQIPFGIRAAGFDEFRNDGAGVQLCSVRTEHKRRKNIRHSDVYSEVYPADLVIIDEGHLMTKGVNREILEEHDCTRLWYTATPVGMSEIGDEIVCGPSLSELRADGFLLLARVYDPGCPNLEKIRRVQSDEAEFSVGIEYVQQICANLHDTWKHRNPEARPSIFFGPDVASSRWIADYFAKRGVRIAHIDSTEVYVDGEVSNCTVDVKDELVAELERGTLAGVTNRFKLREGIDATCLYYCALACPIGSVTSYIQTVGRILRPHPGHDHAIIADHGGNARRHGSPNEDRDWNVLWQYTSSQIERARSMEIKNGTTDPGTPCPACGLMWRRLPSSGLCDCGHEMRRAYECPQCGRQHREWPHGHICTGCSASMRHIRKKPIRETDGSLSFVPDEAFKKDYVRQVPESEKIWKGKFFGHRKHRPTRTLAQCYSAANHEHWQRFRCGLPRTLPLMPKSEFDWGRRCGEVPLEDLR